MLRQLLFRPGRRLHHPAIAVLVCLSLLLFHSVAQAAATPTAAIMVSPSVQIGADFSFTVTFDNSGTNTGYGPFVDLILPLTGADGAGAALDDGIDFSSATYLGQPVVATQLTFPPGVPPTCVTHPYAVDNTGDAYWLHEVEVSGATNEYGPANATRGPAVAGYHVFLPFTRP